MKRDYDETGYESEFLNPELVYNLPEGYDVMEYSSDDSREEFQSTREPKIRRKKHYLLRFFVSVAIVVALYFILTSELFSIHSIEISNINFFSKEQIVEMSGVKLGENMFKLEAGLVESKLENDPYIKDARLIRKPLHNIEIEIDERIELFCVQYNEQYVVADAEGYVLYLTDEIPNMTTVQNLAVIEAEPGKELKVKNNLELADTISLLVEASKNDMFFKDVVSTDVGVKAYLNDIFLCKGDYKDLEKSMLQIKKVIYNLGEKKIGRGSIIVSGNGTCTFTPEL